MQDSTRIKHSLLNTSFHSKFRNAATKKWSLLLALRVRSHALPPSLSSSLSQHFSLVLASELRVCSSKESVQCVSLSCPMCSVQRVLGNFAVSILMELEMEIILGFPWLELEDFDNNATIES